MTKFGKLLFSIIFIIVLSVIIFFLQKKYVVLAPQITENNEVIDKSMPPLDNKDQLLGNRDDLISFSIEPNSRVHGIISYRGIIKGGYFFEANILIGVADINKKIILQSNAMATTDWMTAGPVSFEGNINFGSLPKGSAYIQIHNDNASGLPENNKFILIPIVID